MQKIDKLAHAAKVVALCLPPVVMSLIGLAALSRKKGGATVAGKRPTLRAARRTGWRARPGGPPLPFQPGRPIGNVYCCACSWLRHTIC